jgi:hypothetical protein
VRYLRTVSLGFFAFCVFAQTCAVAQKTTVAYQAQPAPHTGDLSANPTDEDAARNQLLKDMEKKAAKERAAALKVDTDKLLKLSVELKSYVDKADENVLSLDVIKKAEEIEKLARSVKDKMKGPN